MLSHLASSKPQSRVASPEISRMIHPSSWVINAEAESLFNSEVIERDARFTSPGEGSGFIRLDDVVNLDKSNVLNSKLLPVGHRPNYFVMRGRLFVVAAGLTTTPQGIPTLKFTLWPCQTKGVELDYPVARSPYTDPNFRGWLHFGLTHPFDVFMCVDSLGERYLLLDVGDHE